MIIIMQTCDGDGCESKRELKPPRHMSVYNIEDIGREAGWRLIDDKWVCVHCLKKLFPKK